MPAVGCEDRCHVDAGNTKFLQIREILTDTPERTTILGLIYLPIDLNIPFLTGNVSFGSCKAVRIDLIYNSFSEPIGYICHILDADIMEIVIELPIDMGFVEEAVIIIEDFLRILFQFKVVAKTRNFRVELCLIVIKQRIRKTNRHLLSGDFYWIIGVHPITIADPALVQISFCCPEPNNYPFRRGGEAILRIGPVENC